MARPEHLSAALEIHLAWGPERSIPVKERFRAKLPPMADDDLSWLEAQCDAILSQSCRLADAIGFEGLAPEAAHRRLRAQWPTLDDARIGLAMHQAYYSFWRDNGRSPEERPPPKKTPRARSARPKSRRGSGRGG